ncbi:hypothetical protein NLU13_0123 [Sarocladium strictum]|uniref:PH domain-containing protein n=1 Tax=Sarocladium strictum TaxID=5046 RepID=A0AA39LB77_SARSR|nr:hypothetical protein NLU13_0123 [Sarocladium strictum]
MASSLASDKPNLPIPTGDAATDPFVSSPQPPSHHRFSTFDQDLFAAGPGSSPRQAKRALEAHLAETDRRLDEAGKLGTALVSQRKALAEQLQEVEKLQAEGELGPELRSKLVEIEKEYNDLARESARAFLPKQRVPSNEAAPGSPFLPEGRGGRRSVSPSKFESHGSGSPTKLTVPNRKIRNQPSNRVHDIEFAAEISTSLIAQVRNLQALLAEREEEVKELKSTNSALEIESENLQQRLAVLDESEHKYKEANWELETRIQDLNAAQREQTEREKKLTQSLEASTAEKALAQKELDEVKLAHTKLTEEHAAIIKHHDIELGTAKRNLVMADGERSAMQRKIDDLTNQNTELAKAFSTQRGRSQARDPASGLSDEEFETATDNVTPEHSPPPSPIKGTPRHSILETETMKTSLHHAQRTIQSQRSQIHREKTEKLELRRIIQDLRDDLDRAKNDAGTANPNRRSRKVDSKEFKKGKGLLGSFRSSRQEILEDDPDWEDHQGLFTRTSSANVSPVSRQAGDPSFPTDSSDHFETANEASESAFESAFETANERGTETEDFHTVNEDMPDSDGAETETEITSRGFGRMRRPPSLPAGLAKAGNRNSFHSTASTSADEEDLPELKTPTAALSSQRSRGRLSRGPFSRSSRQFSEEPQLTSSPASFVTSTGGTPKAAGQSLFAELQELGSDDESLGPNTPSRRSTRSVTPGSIHRPISPAPAMPELPKVVMVDSGTMTDDVRIDSPLPEVMAPVDLNVDEADRPRTMQSVVDNRASMLSVASDTSTSRPLSTSSYSDAGAQHDADMEEKIAMFPIPPTTLSRIEPPTYLELTLADIRGETIEPVEERREEPTPPTLSLTPVVSEVVDPIEERREPPPPPTLSFTPVLTERVEPVEERREEPIPPTLSFTSVVSEVVEPIEERREPPPPPTLSFTPVLTERVEPGADPAVPAPALSLSSIMGKADVPPTNVEIPPPQLSMTSVIFESVEPVVEAEIEALPVAIPTPVPAVAPEVPDLVISTIASENIEPVQGPDVTRAHDVLGYSSLLMEYVEPIKEPETVRAHDPLAYSTLSSQGVEPVASPELPLPTFVLSSLAAEDIVPVIEEAPIPAPLALSPIASEHVEPVMFSKDTSLPTFGFSSIDSIETRPASPRSPRRDGFILPRDASSPKSFNPETPNNKAIGLLARGKKTDSPPIIAEDETRQSPSDRPETETPESQRPFKEISSNSSARPQRKAQAPMLDQGAQTSLTAEAIDKLLLAGAKPSLGHEKKPSTSSIGSMNSMGTVRIHRQQESLGSPLRNKTKIMDDVLSDTSSLKRPSSAASGRTSLQDAPPLPPNHRELIEAARTGSSSGAPGTMGPPLWPASAMKNRPRTPSGQSRPMSSQSGRGTPTPRAAITGSLTGHADIQQRTRPGTRSRQSSVSSFASEIETRFNMRDGAMGMGANGFGPHTDPRMIQAITQTMIGEYLWKYTRKTGRGEMSEKRHRRYFWVHPYTRALHWSTNDPSTSGRNEVKSKSVPIEAVRVVTDDNPMPPGLHRKSLIVVAPGRTVKFTCTTGQRHETWFNALSYLLLRTNEDQAEADEMATGLTSEDVDEFNPQFGQRPANGTRPRGPPSLSSYNSRTTHNESPGPDIMEIPTLTPSNRGSSTPQQRPSIGTLGRISGYWKSSGPKLSGTFNSFRGRAPSAQNVGIYEASEVHDSAEDLREMIERQDRESDRLENVRACCDGKHDVGALHQHHHSRRDRTASTHAHPTPTATPMSTYRSRA